MAETTNGSHASTPLISGIAHVNITIPQGTLDQAKSFYAGTLGLTSRPVPAAQTAELAWFDIGFSSQQVHVSLAKHDKDVIEKTSSRHPCFKLSSPEALLELQRKVFAHFESGGDDAPMASDAVGQSSGEMGSEYPTRFFARDFAGNRLEFSL